MRTCHKKSCLLCQQFSLLPLLLQQIFLYSASLLPNLEVTLFSQWQHFISVEVVMVSHIPYLAHGTRWDCKAETANVIIRMLGREPSRRWELRSLTAGCAQFAGRKLVMVFKQGSPALGLPADASLESQVRRQWVTLLGCFFFLDWEGIGASCPLRIAIWELPVLVFQIRLCLWWREPCLPLLPARGCSCFPSGWA